MLYLIATPIGHLSDITLRALDTLRMCDYLLCEDTRHSLHLLQHYNIQKPLKSYHKFNETERSTGVLSDLQRGQIIGLLSDAGTPGICDPGASLVRLCIENQFPVTAIPGPCAAIQALACSGLPTERFQFWGFLPRKAGELQRDLQEIFTYRGTTICYESPHRLLSVLAAIDNLQPMRQLVIARELTKRFEEIQRGTARALLDLWQVTAPRGEIVLLIAPLEQMENKWLELSPQEHVEWIQSTYKLDRQAAIKTVAQMRGVPKREIYNQIHGLKSD